MCGSILGSSERFPRRAFVDVEKPFEFARSRLALIGVASRRARAPPRAPPRLSPCSARSTDKASSFRTRTRQGAPCNPGSAPPVRDPSDSGTDRPLFFFSSSASCKKTTSSKSGSASGGSASPRVWVFQGRSGCARTMYSYRSTLRPERSSNRGVPPVYIVPRGFPTSSRSFERTHVSISRFSSSGTRMAATGENARAASAQRASGRADRRMRRRDRRAGGSRVRK